MRPTTRCVAILSSCLVAGGLGLTAPAQAAPTSASPAESVAHTAAAASISGVPTAQRGSADRDLDPRPSTRELARDLRSLELRGHGRIEVDRIGASNQGRPVWSATVGTGPRKILYVTQQHGDEPLTTPAALEFLREVGVEDGRWQQALRGQVSMQIVVRANPDGHEHDWRFNYDPDADPEYGEQGKGYDINRYHDPATAPEDNPATEAGLIQREYAAFAPELVVDYHMQGRYIDDDGEEITSSVYWPSHPDVAADRVDFAKQAAAVAERGMTADGANVSRYPGGDYAGIARNAYGLRGSGSVLIEYSAMGPAHEQDQIRSAYAAMVAIAQAFGNGTVDAVDPAYADAIPPRGDPLPDGADARQPADATD